MTSNHYFVATETRYFCPNTLNKLLFFRGSNSMFLYPAKHDLTENRSNGKNLRLRHRQCWSSVRTVQKKDFDGVQCSWGPGASFNPRPATVATTIQSMQLSYAATSPPLLSNPLPPTGHPEACWNTMPVLAQAPTSGPNMEVTSSGKNGIVSLEKTNTVETLSYKSYVEFRS